jgi:uncharacterized protein DUF4157
MKDFDNEKTDTPQDTAPAINKPKARPAAARDAGHVVSEIASRAHDGDALNASELSHPANAAPLADLLGGLQHSHGNIYVQRVVADMNQPKADAESQSTDKGQSLDGGVMTEMESAFGENFGDVRIHTGDAAERMNDELGARAVTRGRDVYFGAGEYNPASRDGKELLAHELAHVVQQRDAPATEITGVDSPGDCFEQEADRAAKAVLSGTSFRVEQTAGPSFQRQPRAGGAAQQVPGAINLTRERYGGLSGGVTYSYDPANHELTLQGPTQMSVSSIQGGTVVFDSARATMAVSRTRMIRIRVSGPPPLSLSVGGTVFRFVW